ncbi:acyl-CoA synthetase (AMP-forming)/AMP-acid ligase II [Amycolatopsis echigonensis]|uniref:Acyl-CoA synthetase (AMP-forming)/AMP-acid ligase II n=1 Tax=Amycolatopsis echigonensis TaxID=2576905 RepID=A0A2N3WUB2_9PSEU|nr:long-chain-fatty-acid--CoA ligase [Amycolatopsis niigatensis]PKV97461.1 acyl-CoA synthetase (AMP-forming)/AMP-acid ligase II [Amycolatopsis niigatensis]
MYLTQGLHRSVQQTPGAPSTVFGDRERTFAETADRVARLAGALREAGVRQGDRVAILALNSDRYAEFLLAVPWADAVFVPVNIRWAVPEISGSLVECDARVLFVDEKFAPMVPAVREKHPGLATVVYCGDGEPPEGMLGYEQLLAAAEPIEDARRGGGSLAGVYYTGGTTGSAKGVMLSHANLLTSALGSTATGRFCEPGGRMLHAAPMFHLADGAAWAAQTALGGTHVIVPAFDPAGVLAALSERQVTSALLVPTMIGMLVSHPGADGYDLSGVRHLIYGASPISEPVLKKAMALFPNAGFVQAYGMTELSPVATLLLPEDHHDPRRRLSAGRAAPHAEVRIVDEHGEEVPRGTVGEVVSRGGHVMLGYWNQPEATAQAVRDGWMHTGDGGRMDDDGYVYIVDRIKDMIVTGGENVYSVEVEKALALHPAVETCAVIGVPDSEFGERVHAVVVLAAGRTADAEELREFCKQRIAGYKTPRSVEFVESLPLSGAGKILKRDLRARHWGGRQRAVH